MKDDNSLLFEIIINFITRKDEEFFKQSIKLIDKDKLSYKKRVFLEHFMNYLDATNNAHKALRALIEDENES